MLWRHFLYDWLRRQASARVAEAGSEKKAPLDSPPAAKSEDCHLGIVVSAKTETGSILDRLCGVIKTKGYGFIIYEGSLQGRRIAVVESGCGPADAAAATRALLGGHRPAWVVAAGFAGALVPTLRRGDLLIADSVADESGRRLNIDIQSREETGNREFYGGRIVSVAQQPASPAAKRELAARTQALAVDTSSMAVAEVCRESDVLCLVVRIIRDSLEDSLPDEVKNLRRQESFAGRLGAAAGALAKRPSSAKDWWKLKQESLHSADRLALFLENIIQQLIPRSSLNSLSREASGPSGRARP